MPLSASAKAQIDSFDYAAPEEQRRLHEEILAELDRLRAAVEQARAEERERCAKIVEATNGMNWGYSTKDIARAIRSAPADRPTGN